MLWTLTGSCRCSWCQWQTDGHLGCWRESRLYGSECPLRRPLSQQSRRWTQSHCRGGKDALTHGLTVCFCSQQPAARLMQAPYEHGSSITAGFTTSQGGFTATAALHLWIYLKAWIKTISPWIMFWLHIAVKVLAHLTDSFFHTFVSRSLNQDNLSQYKSQLVLFRRYGAYSSLALWENVIFPCTKELFQIRILFNVIAHK